MFRASAILLLAVISFWLSAPAFASAESRLPVCCRTKGAHKCAMKIAHLRQGPAVSAKCACFPSAGSLSAGGSAPVAVPLRSIAAPLANQPAILAQTEAHFRISFARSQQKRGPPALL